MSRPRPIPTRRRGRRLLSAVLVAASLALAACSGATAVVATFDPLAPCPAEGQMPGAFPDLEALLPAEWEGKAPDNVDSGRSCTPGTLGALADLGVEEVRFAGATWRTGGTSGWTLAAFTGDGVNPETMRRFYQAGATEARRTEKAVPSTTTVGGESAERLDVLMSDGAAQTMVAWKGADDDVTWVLLAADLGDTRVADLLAGLGSR
jgi:hypothetical protein